jgi:hypothetical protein
MLAPARLHAVGTLYTNHGPTRGDSALLRGQRIDAIIAFFHGDFVEVV